MRTKYCLLAYLVIVALTIALNNVTLGYAYRIY